MSEDTPREIGPYVTSYSAATGQVSFGARPSKPTFTEFLLARLADREADIRRRQTYAVWHTERCIFEGGYEGSGSCDCGAVDLALADIEAKRRIVELHGGSHECSTYDHNGDVDNCTWCLDAIDCSTMRLLTSVYADHPDYAPSWRV